MRKILFVTNHLQYSDGVAQALLNLVNSLDEKKYEIDVCALFKKDDKFISQFKNSVKIFSVFNGYFKGLSKLLKLVPKKILLKKIIKQKYDIVIAYQFGLPTVLLSNKYVQIPKIAFMHGYDESAVRYHKNYNKIVCVAESSSIKYSKLVDFPHKITYCHNVLNLDDIKEKAKEVNDISQEFKAMQKPIISFVGRLSEEKGIERTLNILKHIKDDGLKFTYVIIGDGNLRNKINMQINELGLTENVKMYGFQKNPYKYLSLSNAYFCGSYSEGLCTACIEACVLGLDVLSTEVSGANEIIYNPDIGTVCKNNDEGIYQCLKDYIEKDYANQTWKLNKNESQQKWKKENVIKKFEDILCEVGKI